MGGFTDTNAMASDSSGNVPGSDLAMAIGMLAEPFQSQARAQFEKEMRDTGGTLTGEGGISKDDYGNLMPSAVGDITSLVGGGVGQPDPKAVEKATKDILSSPMAKYLETFSKASVASQTQEANVAQSIKTIQDATTAQIGAVKDYVDASTAVNNITQEFKAKTDQRNAETINFFNADPSKAGNELEKLAGDMKANYEQATTLDKQIQAKKAVSFFENPLAHIVAQLTLPGDVATYNGYARAYNAAEERYKTITGAVTATGQMDATVQQGTSLALRDAQNKELMAKAKIDALKITQEGAKIGIEGYKTLASMTSADLSAAAQSVNVDLEIKKFALYKTSQELQELQKQTLIAGLQDRIKQKQVTAEEMQSTLDFYNAGALKFGAPTQSNPAVVMKWITQGKADALNYYNWGQNSQLSGRTIGLPLAPSAGQAAETLYTSRANNPVMNDSNSPAAFMASEYEAALRNPQFAAIRDPKQRDAALSEVIHSDIIKKFATISPDESNPYQAPAIQTIVKALPIVTKNPFVANSIVPLGTEGQANQPANPEMILGAAKTYLADHPEKFQETVQGIAQFFRAATLVNNHTKDYLSYGLPNQVQYNAKLKFGNIFGASTSNLTDETEVARLLMTPGGLGNSGLGFR